MSPFIFLFIFILEYIYLRNASHTFTLWLVNVKGFIRFYVAMCPFIFILKYVCLRDMHRHDSCEREVSR
jgi:hypothetical protein